MERLDGEHRREMIPVDSVLPRMRVRPEDRVVDLGAGIGYFALPLSSLSREVVAVDIEPKILSILKARAHDRRAENVSLLKAEITSLPMADGSADKVLAAFVYHEVESQKKLIQECHRILRPSGSLTVIDFQKRFTRDGPPIWVRKRPKHVLATGAGMFRLDERFDSRVYYQLRLDKI